MPQLFDHYHRDNGHSLIRLLLGKGGRLCGLFHIVILIIPMSYHPALGKFFELYNPNIPWCNISSYFFYSYSLGVLPF